MPITKPIITRLAPSPTGRLHLGNAWSFMLCWLAARSTGGMVYMRMEDIDANRCKQEYSTAIMEDLGWLGLDWDEPAAHMPFVQSERCPIYASALAELERKELVYPCFCSRRELKALAQAPHAGESFSVYPGTCAALSPVEVGKKIAAGKQHCLRLKTFGQSVAFVDIVQGPQFFTHAEYGGDFALKRADGIWAYQFATALDDALMGINLVIRGRDLIDSTPRQLLVMRSLALPEPAYAHIPLLLDNNGERLAKRHNSLSLAHLRLSGVKPQSIIGLLAKLAGIKSAQGGMDLKDLYKDFTLENLPKNDIVIGEQELACLYS